MKGNFELKKQINGIGLFCIIELEIEKSKDGQLIINYNNNDLDDLDDFKIAVEYGILLALENLSFKGLNRKRDFKITITKFQSIIVDTSLSCVSYASCRAIYNAFSCESKMLKPNINEFGDFVF